MKIELIVVQIEGKFPKQKITYATAKTISEAKKISKDCIDIKTYSYIKALERNQTFISTISSLRKKFNVPENGYDLESWSNLKKSSKKDQSFSRWSTQAEIETIKRLLKLVHIHPLLVSSLPDIMISNSIFVPLQKIFIETPYSTRQKSSYFPVKINISSRVTINQLIKFIENNQQEIQKALDTIDKADLFISQRDFRIVDFRDNERFPYGKIAELLANENEDEDNGQINEDSVKRAYHEAKKKIQALTK